MLIIAGVMLASVLQTLDSTIVNTALPTIQGNLGASQDEGTWVITAYVIASLVIIPLTPSLQSRFGRKRYFLVSIVGFTLASALCGTSESLQTLIAARAVQGAFGGGLLVTGQSIVRDTFPPSGLAASQGIFALGAMMGPALGPPLGGYLVDNFSWNWCFDINLLPGALSLTVLFLLLRDPHKPNTSNPIDGVGVALLATGLASLQFVLTEGEQNDWFNDPLIASIGVVSGLALAAFGWWELTQTAHPIVDLRIMRNRTVWAGFVLSFALGVANLGSSYALPQFTQGSLGYPPTLSGLVFMFRIIPMGLVTPLAVRFTNRVDPRYLCGAGFALMSFANFLQARITTPTTSYWDFLIPMGLSGIASAFLWVPLTVAILAALPQSDGPKAASFSSLALSLGGTVAVVSAAVLLHARESFHSTIIGGNLTMTNPMVQQFLAKAPLALLAQITYAQSTIVSFADVYYAIAGIVLLSVPLIFLLRRRRTAVPLAVEIEVA